MRRPVLTVLGALALAAALAGPADAGTVILMNDEEIDGEIMDITIDYVSVRVKGAGTQRIPMREVRDVEFRPGETLWEKQYHKVKDDLKRQREAREKKRLEKAGEAVDEAPVAPQTPVGNLTEEQLRQQQAVVDTSRLGKEFKTARYPFTLKYPGEFKQGEPELQFLTFKDEIGAVAWSFNVTFFEDEGDFETIRQHAQAEIEILKPAYRPHSRSRLQIGRNAERSSGLYERGGRAIRHDQVVAECRGGVLVFNFFSPGATLDENAVPDVEAVISSLSVK